MIDKDLFHSLTHEWLSTIIAAAIILSLIIWLPLLFIGLLLGLLLNEDNIKKLKDRLKKKKDS